MSENNQFNFDINNLNIIDLKNVIKKSPHLIKNIFNKIDISDIVLILYDLDNDKLQQSIFLYLIIFFLN